MLLLVCFVILPIARPYSVRNGMEPNGAMKLLAYSKSTASVKEVCLSSITSRVKNKTKQKKLNKIYIMIAIDSKRFPFKMKFQIKCYNYIYGQVLFTVLVWLRAIILLISCAKRNVLKSRKIRK